MYMQPLSNATLPPAEAFRNATPKISVTQPCTGFFCSPAQASQPVHLVKGQQYLVEARHWQWGGSAHFALATITPSAVIR